MPFFIAGAIAVSAISASSAASASNAATAKSYIQSLKVNEATNKAIGEANLQNTIRTGYRAGIVNVQRGQSKQQAVKAGWDISTRSNAALGQTQANAAASGTTGSSTDAVVDDIRRKVDEAQGQVDQSWETTQLNFDNYLNDLIQQGKDSLQTAQRPDTAGPTYADPDRAAIIAGASTAASFATSYGVSQMQLGLGSSRSVSGMGGGQGFQNNGSSISGFRSPSASSGGGSNYSIY